MAKLTARDYKKSARRAFDFTRMREFGAGALIGAVLTSAFFLYIGEVRRAPAEDVRPQPRHTAPADAEPIGAHSNDERYDFYEMLPHFEVVVPEKERDVRHDLPTARVERKLLLIHPGQIRAEIDQLSAILRDALSEY